MADDNNIIEQQQAPVDYNDDNIRTLSGTEHIRLRPGMYIGRLGDGSLAEDGIYVLLKEVIDNSIDEFKMKAGDRIEINVDDNLRAYGVPAGANVYSVNEDSPAEKAGLKKNDVIVEANDEAITGSDDLVKLIRSSAAGDEVELVVYRQGENVELTVAVGENVKSALPEPEPTEKPEK